MAVLPASFWGGWAAVLIVVGLSFIAYLAIGVFRDRDATAPGDVWDGDLREGNDEPPKWWFYALFSVLVFSAGYILLYPGFGDNTGILKWSQHTQLAEGMAYYQERTKETRQQWETAPLATLAEDDSAMRSAARIYANNCATCHGDNADGQAGLFPSLIDDEWLWGGDEQQILHSLRQGRVAVMPGWESAFSNAQIAALTDYLIGLADGSISAGDDHPARQNYLGSCAACHGQNAEGNPALGAPRFVNHRWLYAENGDIRASVEKSIREGRNGIMPAQQGRLTEAQIRLLAAWLKHGKE